MLFANDCALNTESEQEMQRSMDKFSSACDAINLTISTKKTAVMYQPVPQKEYSEPSITVNGETLKAVNKFTYLVQHPFQKCAQLSTMKLHTELLRPVLHLVNSAERFGKGKALASK